MKMPSASTPERNWPPMLACAEFRIVRDYGMFDRREAPQYYPEARRSEPSA